MSINNALIDKTIECSYVRTSRVCQTILATTGKFVQSRRYLAADVIQRKLALMGYHADRAAELTTIFHQCVELAYERGVFVVSSRVVNLSAFEHDDPFGREPFEPETPQGLLDHFKAREPNHFDALQWYEPLCFEKHLADLHYHHDIARELGPFFLLHVRAAFTRGLKNAANQVVVQIAHIH